MQFLLIMVLYVQWTPDCLPHNGKQAKVAISDLSIFIILFLVDRE